MEFRVLGTVEALSNGLGINIGSRKQRLVLAVLLLEVNRQVAVDRLIDLIWEHGAPTSARSTIQVLVSRLRAAFRDTADDRPEIVGHAAGYLLRADPLSIDAHKFLDLTAKARAADDERTVELFDQALALWRGEALADVASGEVRERLCGGLREARWTALEDRVNAQLRLGGGRQVIAELTQLVAEHPLRQQLVGQLMLALHHSGRTNDALETFRKLRTRLADELGLDPVPQLRQLEISILRTDPRLNVAQQEPVADGPIRPAELPADHGPLVLESEPTSHTPMPPPRQLPAGVGQFVGRQRELDQLDAAWTGPDRLVVVVGVAGVGKTALVVHWAHQVRDRFPDGQLYVNLHGFDPSGATMTPTDVLRGFLEALQVPASQVPTSLSAQIGLYRTLLSGRRMLIVLDNAREAEQVRPLLPGASGCLVVVTSRNQLTSLVAAEGAHPLVVDLLTAEESRALLARRLGAVRVAAESDATDEIVSRCARLPLALSIVAARAATNPAFPLEALAKELRDDRGGLAGLDGGDAATNVRAVFSWSYRTLGTAAARMFRLLGIHPGAEIGTAAAASLCGLPAEDALPLLAELTHAYLITERIPGRYTFHDLLRAYATELAHATDTDAERRTALHRTLDHYLHTGHTASRLLFPHRNQVELDVVRPQVTPEALADHRQARVWYEAEHPTLLAAIEEAARTGFDSHTWQLAWTVENAFSQHGHLHDLIAAQHTALRVTRRLSDGAGQAHLHRGLARAHAELGLYPEAQTHLAQALALFAELGRRTDQAHTHLAMASVCDRQGHYQPAMEHNRLALDLYEAVGHRSGWARAINGIGWSHARLGDHEQALAFCQQAIGPLQEAGDGYGEGATWDSLGFAHHHLGDHRQAAVCYQRALDTYGRIGERSYKAATLTRLGDAYHAAGDPDAARLAWQQALDLLNEFGNPDAEQVRAKLDRP